ncbi:hypothetical protein SBDP1_60017 [Syntrophobacter sp. SbD1]|nr:hypothetical protein SBDP1_60017 [Syntrophobacter sp. SbD1]
MYFQHSGTNVTYSVDKCNKNSLQWPVVSGQRKTKKQSPGCI